MNKIELVGRLCADPDLKYTAGTGNAVAKFKLAVNRPQLDKSKPKEADFISCVCFGKKAEVVANYVQKGHLFGCTGRLQISKYVDKDGQNRYSTDVVVEDIEFLQPKGNNNTQHNSGNNENYDYGEEMTTIDSGDVPF